MVFNFKYFEEFILGKTVWLRHETKPFERRSALTPEACRTLAMLGHNVVIESSANRIYKDEEFKRLGLKIVKPNSWITDAPKGAIVVGLKELEDQDFPLIHRHIHFAHVYKGQEGSTKMLSRFIQGEGKLYDLEYLTNSDGKRVSAFGIWAGFVGAALAVNTWSYNQKGLHYNDKAPLEEWENSNALISDVLSNFEDLNMKPRVLIIGARGRCGTGAIKLLRSIGIDPVCWSTKDTKGIGPIEEILDFDILINCALAKKPRPPFLNAEILKKERNLKVISDVACDPTGPCNPLPIYNQITTMDLPILNMDYNGELLITAIDHLPSLLPRESSEDYCDQLLPHLIDFLDNKIEKSPWERSLEIFYHKTMELGIKDELIIDPDSNKLM